MQKPIFNAKNFIETNQTGLKQKLSTQHEEVVALGDLQLRNCYEFTPNRYQIDCTLRVGMEEYDPEQMPSALEQGNIWIEPVEIILDLNAPSKVRSIQLRYRDYSEWIESDEEEILQNLNLSYSGEIQMTGVSFQKIDGTGGEETFKVYCIANGYHVESDVDFEEEILLIYPVKFSENHSFLAIGNP